MGKDLHSLQQQLMQYNYRNMNQLQQYAYGSRQLELKLAM